jgi:hypothetical protein
MRLKLELNISVSERSEKIKAEDISVEKTGKPSPISNREELKAIDFVSVSL